MASTFPIEKFRQLPTPFYYYDTDVLVRTLEAIRTEANFYGNYKVHYAIKANANAKVLRIISRFGMGADCVSGGEVQAAVDAGFQPDNIVFAGVGKTDWEIKLGLKHDIACFNVESIQELEVISQLAAEAHVTTRVALRINPDIGAHTHANITTGLAENKFGISMDNMDDVISMAIQLPNISLTGLHFHIGSQITDMEDFVMLCNRINDLQSQILTRHNLIMPHINVGGGLGVDYVHPDKFCIPDFKNYFATFHKHLRLYPSQILHFELGRAVVAQCGSLISTVTYVKQGTSKQFAILDAGMNDLIRPALYQAYHHVQNLSSNLPKETYDVVGPVCESSDVFRKAVELNRTKRGDLLAIRSAGAYGEIMASVYNCRPLPKGYVTEDLYPL